MPAGFGQARICDLTGKRVLDRILTLTRHRRAGTLANEVLVLECHPVGLLAFEKLPNRTGPERTPDNRSRLQPGFLARREQIDARGDHRLDRVRHFETGRKLARAPEPSTRSSTPVSMRLPSSSSTKNGLPGTLEDDLAQAGWQLQREHLLDQAPGVRFGQRL